MIYEPCGYIPSVAQISPFMPDRYAQGSTSFLFHANEKHFNAQILQEICALKYCQHQSHVCVDAQFTRRVQGGGHTGNDSMDADGVHSSMRC